MAPLEHIPLVSLPSLAMQHLTLLVTEPAIAYQVYAWIYNLYLHPLSHVPGPRLWAMSRIPQESSMVRGRLHRDIRALHERYGDVVRVAPRALSFISPEAWTDVMARRAGQKVPQRDILRFADSLRVNGAPELLTADDAVHSRHRRMFAHAFSERTMDTEVGLANWLNLTTSDVLGTSAFGETFGCLETGDYTPWLRIIFESVWAVTVLGSIRQFPWADWVLRRLVDGTIMRVTREHHRLTIEKVSRRLDVFHPSRWLGNPVYETDRRGALRPFGIGSRVCIGKHLALGQVRTIISRLLFNFDIELCPESDNWTDQRAFWTWERLPMWVQLKERRRGTT